MSASLRRAPTVVPLFGQEHGRLALVQEAKQEALSRPPILGQQPADTPVSCSPAEFSPLEALSLLFRVALPRETATREAQAILEKFGSLGAVLCASKQSFSDFEYGDDLWELIKGFHSIMMSVLREPLIERPVISDSQKLHDYLKISLAHVNHEVVRLLFLNSKNALLRDELHTRGTTNHTPIYPREVVRRVVEIGANALIIVHNHPSGDPTPSAEDIEMTGLLARVLEDIGVRLHDHVIVGLAKCQSMRALGLLQR